MAAGQIYQGKAVRFTLDGKVLFHATSCKMSVSTTLESIATKDTNGTVSTPSNYEWSMTTDALVADKPTASVTQSGFIDLLQLQLSKTPIQVEFSTQSVGDFIASGQVFIESADIDATVNQSVSGSFSFKGNGDLTLAIVA
jgi:hypothetical protein